MPLTNLHGLPASIVRAIENDPYDAGDADISTTRLINPPQLEALRLRHKEEIVEDASERIWSLLGQSVHAVLERAASASVVSERRYFAELDGWKVSGAVDLIEDGVLVDYKVTSVWTLIFGSRIVEWTAQANINRWLAWQNGERSIESAKNVLILRDWNQRDHAKPANQGRGYPPVAVAAVPLALWALDETEAYMHDRIALHKAARAATPETMRPCSEEENWNGRRCDLYCPVSKFCKQLERENA